MDRPDFDNTMRIIDRVNSRMPEGGIHTMNINSYIANMTDMARVNSSIPVPGEREHLEGIAGMYTYLRDNVAAQTVGEAVDALSRGKVDAGVVAVWVEAGMAIDPMEYKAIEKGYPTLVPALKKSKDDWWEAHKDLLK